jgi:hypothetical protein
MRVAGESARDGIPEHSTFRSRASSTQERHWNFSIAEELLLHFFLAELSSSDFEAALAALHL